MNRCSVLAASYLLVVLTIAGTPTQAYTLFEIGSETANRQIHEGYSGDIDLLMQEVELSRSRTSSQPRHFIHQQHALDEVTIVSVGSTVYSDIDKDGFFTHFSVAVDADIHWGEAAVYIRVWLRSNADDYTEFHTSESFYIYDNLASDSYTIESKLLNNYPADYYDVRVDVLDAVTDALLDTVDAESHATLFALPLESARHEEGPAKAIIHSHVGSLDSVIMLLLAAFTVLRRNKYRPTV